MENGVYFIYERGDDESLTEAVRRLAESSTDTEGLTVSEADGEAEVEFRGLTAKLRVSEGNTDHWEAPVPDLPHAYLQFNEKDVPEYKFSNAEIMQQSDDYLQSVTRVVDLVAATYEQLQPKPTVGYGVTDSDCTLIAENEDISIPMTHEGVRNGELSYVPWIVIATEAIISNYGRDTLLGIPSWKTRELDDGSVFIISYANVLTQSEGPVVPRNEHLGIDLPIEGE